MDWQQQVKGQKTSSIVYTEDEILQRRIETVCDGLLPNVAALFVELSEPNKRVITDFVLDLINRKNVAVNTKSTHIKNLVYLVRNWNGMDLKDMKREHIDSYLQGIRRSKEKDPDEKWISTHNTRAMTYSGFFRYRYFPDMEPEKRAKETPDVIAGITFFKRKSKTHVKPTHLWLAAEDEVFLRYCPDPRVSFYHVVADDSSGRPHEILAKRIGDVKIINILQ